MQQQPSTPAELAWAFKSQIEMKKNQTNYQLDQMKRQEDAAVKELQAALSKPNNAIEANEKARGIAIIRKQKAQLSRAIGQYQSYAQTLTAHATTVDIASTMQQMQQMMAQTNRMMDPVAIQRMRTSFAAESAKSEQIEEMMAETMDTISQSEIDSTINTESANVLREVMDTMPSVATNPLATGSTDNFMQFLSQMSVNKV